MIQANEKVGKTSFVNRFQAKAYEDSRTNVSATVHPVIFDSPTNPIKFNVYDSFGQEKFGSGFRDSYYIGADCAIMMFDVTNRLSYKNIPNWHRDIIRSGKFINRIGLFSNFVEFLNAFLWCSLEIK
jgi:GTP-binding nuclear protein Ran